MKPLLFAMTLLLATATFAQSPGYPQSSSPQQTVPDQRVPLDETMKGQEPISPESTAPAQVEQEIQQAFQAQPALSNAKLTAVANDSSVVVKGTVVNEKSAPDGAPGVGATCKRVANSRSHQSSAIGLDDWRYT